MADPFRDLGPISKAFVLVAAAVFAFVLALGVYAAFFLEEPVAVVPRAILVLAAAAAIVWAQRWFGRSVREAREHMQSPVGRIQKAIRDSRKSGKR